MAYLEVCDDSVLGFLIVEMLEEEGFGFRSIG